VDEFVEGFIFESVVDLHRIDSQFLFMRTIPSRDALVRDFACVVDPEVSVSV